jgi:hypothetical protein
MEPEILEDEIINEISLTNIPSNKTRKKVRQFNEFSVVTKLIKKYKQKEDEKVLLEIIKALEGIINTFTIIVCPGDPSQQIYLNPYMKKFIGMFLTKEEQNSTTYMTYMQAVYRIRWVMRYWTYEDLYAELIKLLVDIVKKIRIIGDCDCIYYIQFVMKFKMHGLVVKTAKDIMVDIKEMPTDFNATSQNDGYEDTLERLTLGPDNYKYEDRLIESLYDEIDLDILTNKEDVFKYFCSYEKYIIYLHEYLLLTPQKISSILKESLEEVTDRLDDIKYKLEQFTSN